MTKATPHVRVQMPEPTPVVTMIERGRRAYGESWRKITIGHDGDKYVIDNQPTEAPADEQPIIVPVLGAMSADMADYILEWHRKEAEYRKSHGQRRAWMPSYEQIQQAFLDYCEERLRWFKGQTQSGPSQTSQRASLPQMRRA